jgi:hypothetical protein
VIGRNILEWSTDDSSPLADELAYDSGSSRRPRKSNHHDRYYHMTL